MLTNTRFTIGEMARMHRIPESTLRYYDEKGIFHPTIVDPQTQYRYYTLDQFSMLDLIKFLRHLDIPLKQIKQYIDERTPSNVMDLLVRQKMLLEQKQKEIALMITRLDQNIDTIHQAFTRTKDTVNFKQIPKRTITSVEMDPSASTEMFEYCIHSLQNNRHLHDVSLFVGAIGVILSKEALLRKDYEASNRLFINVNYLSTLSENDHVIEEGLFVCAYHYGPYDQTPETYEMLIQKIEEQDYEIVGDGIEIVVIDLSMTSNPDEYISEIQIPVRKR